MTHVDIDMLVFIPTYSSVLFTTSTMATTTAKPKSKLNKRRKLNANFYEPNGDSADELDVLSAERYSKTRYVYNLQC